MSRIKHVQKQSFSIFFIFTIVVPIPNGNKRTIKEKTKIWTKFCVTCHMSGVRCQLSVVRCQVSGVRCQVSGVRCQVSGVIHHPSFDWLPIPRVRLDELDIPNPKLWSHTTTTDRQKDFFWFSTHVEASLQGWPDKGHQTKTCSSFLLRSQPIWNFSLQK